MRNPAAPRRAAAIAGIAVALAAGAAGGLVAADLERSMTASTAAASTVPEVPPLRQPTAPLSPTPLSPAPTSPAPSTDGSAAQQPSLTPAPAPQSSRPGQQPHTTTRAS